MRLLLIPLLMLSFTASAQIVNVQSRFRGEAKEGLQGNLEGSADWRTGSNDVLFLRGALTTQLRRQDHILMLLLQGEYGLSERERILARTLEHLRYRYAVRGPLWLEGFVQHEYDQFRRLELRGLVGLGPRVTLSGEDRFSSAAGASLMLEHERIRQDALPQAGDVYTDLRLSTYGMARVALAQNLDLIETVYLQPRLVRWSDYRVLNETTLAAQLYGWMTLSTAFTLVMDRAPPAGVSPVDTQLRALVGVTF